VAEKDLRKLRAALIENRPDKVDVDQQVFFFRQLGKSLLDAFAGDDAAERCPRLRGGSRSYIDSNFRIR
jgi:hypothetical protein